MAIKIVAAISTLWSIKRGFIPRQNQRVGLIINKSSILHLFSVYSAGKVNSSLEVFSIRKYIIFFLALFVLVATTTGCSPGEKTVVELSGNNSKKSGIFEIKTNNAKMEFDVKGSDTLLFTAFVVPEGESIDKNILAPDAKSVKPTSDTIKLGKEPGKYFLTVTSLNADWTVKITEEK